MSAKPGQNLFLGGQRLVGLLLQPATSTSTATATAATTATATATSSATTTATRAVPVKPVKPLRKAKEPKTLKTITVDDRVAKYGKCGLYNNNGVLTCGPCGQRLDYTRDNLITTHITRDAHDRKCAARISNGALYVLAAWYEERANYDNTRQHNGTMGPFVVLHFVPLGTLPSPVAGF